MNINSVAIYHEPYIRLAFFAAIFALVAMAELFAPRRKLVVSKQKRWINNILLSIANTIVLRFVFPILPVGVALFCSQREY
jgi:hypothetical protein